MYVDRRFTIYFPKLLISVYFITLFGFLLCLLISKIIVIFVPYIKELFPMTFGSLALLTRKDLLLLVIISNRSPLTTIAALPLSTDRILGELEMTIGSWPFLSGLPSIACTSWFLSLSSHQAAGLPSLCFQVSIYIILLSLLHENLLLLFIRVEMNHNLFKFNPFPRSFLVCFFHSYNHCTFLRGTK